MGCLAQITGALSIMKSELTTPMGQILGVQKSNHLEFLGIRYAKPPVGELRFSEPELVERWEGIYDATKYAAIAPQIWADDPPINMEESEDCLFLNIYTPNADDKKRPVLFYSHGGAFAIGSGSRGRLYGGHLCERGDVVVVTIQYRLGPLGFLYMDGVPANLGLKDQICALKWVKQNIALFGGDPNNITIFGQSAGSIAVSYLLTMPDAKGLFHKAIAQSATLPLESDSPEKAMRITKKFLSKLKIKIGDVDALRNLTWQEIIAAQRKVGKDILSENHHAPVADGVSIPTNPLRALREGASKDIPLIIGHTTDEFPIFRSFVNPQNFIIRSLAKRLISKRLVNMGIKKDELKRVLQIYKEKSANPNIPNIEYDELATDLGFRLPSLLVADAHSNGEAGTFFYEFAYKAPNIGVAMHVLDLFFVFGTLDTSDVTDGMRPSQSEGEKSLSTSMMDAWVNFARTGNPNHPNLPEWREYNKASRAIMILDVEPQLKSNHLEDRIELWKSLSLL